MKQKQKQKQKEDHRTRVGIERRKATRRRLVDSALLVFARRGAGGAVIDDVIAEAQVSRGTFYNYFRTDEELLKAVAEEVGNQILQVVYPVSSARPDPAARVACGVRLTLAMARTHPHLAAFVARVGPAALGSNSLAAAYVPRDIADGMACGRFTALHPRLAFDLVTGPVLAAFHTLLHKKVPASFAEDMAQAILQSLGVAKATARRIARTPLPALVLPKESLFVRADARAARTAA